MHRIAANNNNEILYWERGGEGGRGREREGEGGRAHTYIIPDKAILISGTLSNPMPAEPEESMKRRRRSLNNPKRRVLAE